MYRTHLAGASKLYPSTECFYWWTTGKNNSMQMLRLAGGQQLPWIIEVRCSKF